MCFLKSCCDDKHALLALLIGGMCKLDPDHASEVRDKLLLRDAWASLESDCWGSLCWLLIINPMTVRNVSAYGVTIMEIEIEINY